MDRFWVRLDRRPALYLELFDVVGRDVEADADGDEDEADDEEGGQDGSRREDRLPGGEPLLLEGGVFGLLARQRAAPGSGTGHTDVSVLVFVAGGHHGLCCHCTVQDAAI